MTTALKIRDHRDVILRPVVSEKSYNLLDDGLNRTGKRRRTKYGYGKKVDTKRAIVTVAEGQSIDIFGGPVN